MAGEQSERPVTVNRDELYAQVWDKPMSRLAAEYGISGVGLAKICRRLNVPYPARGYWARKAAGHPVKQTPLPAKPGAVPSQVTIAPTPPPPAPPQSPPELEAALAAAREQLGRVAVPDRLARPHPIVAAWMEERKRRRQEARQWHRPDLVPADFTPLERRRHRILNALFTALERYGFAATLDDRGKPRLEIDKEPADVMLKEKYRQVRRPLTADEKQRGYNPKRPWKQETQATGLLMFSIDTHLHPALVHSWIDEPERPLEQQVAEIAAVMLAAAPILRERRRAREEAEKRRHEEEMRRYEEQQRARRDGNRWRHFVGLARRWQDAEIARQFLAALESKLGDAGAPFAASSGGDGGGGFCNRATAPTKTCLMLAIHASLPMMPVSSCCAVSMARFLSSNRRRARTTSSSASRRACRRVTAPRLTLRGGRFRPAASDFGMRIWKTG